MLGTVLQACLLVCSAMHAHYAVSVSPNRTDVGRRSTGQTSVHNLVILQHTYPVRACSRQWRS